MQLYEIKAAVDNGERVCWANEGYEVRHMNMTDRYEIVCTWNGSMIGLTWADGVTLNGRPEEFFIAGPRTREP